MNISAEREVSKMVSAKETVSPPKCALVTQRHTGSREKSKLSCDRRLSKGVALEGAGRARVAGLVGVSTSTRSRHAQKNCLSVYTSSQVPPSTFPVFLILYKVRSILRV